MKYLEDLYNDNELVPGMSFDLMIQHTTITYNFFIITNIFGSDIEGTHPAYDNSAGRLNIEESYWARRLRLTNASYKKLIFKQQLSSL